MRPLGHRDVTDYRGQDSDVIQIRATRLLLARVALCQQGNLVPGAYRLLRRRDAQLASERDRHYGAREQRHLADGHDRDGIRWQGRQLNPRLRTAFFAFCHELLASFRSD